MSYSVRQAKDEREQEVSEAMQTRDSEALYRLASLYKEEGDDEGAEMLLFTARKIEREDTQGDQARADQKEREQDLLDEHFAPSEGNDY